MIDIKLPGGVVVSGSHPLIIIGPNGVGKTRLGVNVANSNAAERVAALRNVEIPEIPMQRLEQASREVKSALQQVLSQHWRQSYELQNLLSEILAEDREQAVLYREQSINEPTKPLDRNLANTRLRRIVDIWNRHFPNREIKITYEPYVERTIDGKTHKYPIAQMSEGERTALYLAARVVSCNSKMMLVDEPESYFHPLLARGFWDDLEDAAPEIRFIYITHDIPFALSRRRAQFAIARSETLAELLPSASTLPADLVAQIFGAASFSVMASRLVFCEGLQNSYDYEILSAWHNCPRTAVVSAGGCEAVRECVSVFRSGRVTGGLEAFGYIDRDGLPDSNLLADQYVKAQSVYEIEGLVCIEEIFLALASYHDIPAPDANARYQSFLTKAKNEFTGVLLNREVLNRAKKRAEIMLVSIMNPIKPDPDLNNVRTKFESASPVGGWQDSLKKIFREEEARLATSLQGPTQSFLRYFPSKSYYSHAATQLGMSADALVRTMCQALKLTEKEADENKKLKDLRDAVVAALTPIMWPRKA